MCNKNSLNPPHDHMPRRSKRIIRKREPNNELVSPNNTSRKKSRTITRKPKFLSLKRQLSQENMSTQQLNLFPLQPGNIVDEKPTIDIHDENVALLFHNSEDGEGSASLNGILTNTNTTTTTTTTASNSEEDSMNFNNLREEDQEYSLVRTAMRSREREYGREEKWVCYSDVVERKKMVEIEEDTSSSCAFAATKRWRDQKRSASVEVKGSSLALKLDDYQGILNAWSDSGRSLYIQQDNCPRTVPDLLLDDFYAQDNNMVTDVLGVGDVWKVPEMGSNNVMSCGGAITKNNNGKELEGRSENWKLGQREASVLRYKEKRQSRLFSKRIRYQVRKLNAEKRPRMKGRFVKRN